MNIVKSTLTHFCVCACVFGQFYLLYFNLACQYYSPSITGNEFPRVLHKWLGQSKFSFQALGMKTVDNKVGSISESLCLRAAAESPSSRRFPLPESLCFFIFFWRASSRWLPRVMATAVALACLSCVPSFSPTLQAPEFFKI